MSTETNELGASGAKQKRSSYSENGNEANSKEDVLLQHVEISVSESEKRANGSLNLREYYTVYLIETKAIDPDYEERLSKLETVWRRYTEFEQLRDYLEATYPYVVLPPLPEKRVMFGWQKLSTDTFDPDFVDRRRAGLENFLLRVAAHPVLSWDEHFIEFLRHEDGWRESLRANGYLQVAESKLKSLNVSVRLKNGDPHFDNLKTYAGAFHTNVYNLLKARSRVAEKQYTVYKLHRNYGRVFSEWSAVEREMGDALQKTGHYLDSLASSIDASLEDEELLVDQLKEYLFFASSLQNVCRHQETLRYAVEVAEENVAAKNVERVKAQQGKLGLMSRLFGAVDTDEVRELKVNVLDQQIQEGAIAVNKANEELKLVPRRASPHTRRQRTLNVLLRFRRHQRFLQLLHRFLLGRLLLGLVHFVLDLLLLLLVHFDDARRHGLHGLVEDVLLQSPESIALLQVIGQPEAGVEELEEHPRQNCQEEVGEGAQDHLPKVHRNLLRPHRAPN